MADPNLQDSEPAPVSFADGYPLLVCNQASLADLNTRMPKAIPMQRFRPNIVLSGLAAFEEDRIGTLQWCPVTLQLVKPCTRCIITSTDQLTGERSTNPLPVLRTFRFDRALLGRGLWRKRSRRGGHGATHRARRRMRHAARA